MTSRFQDKFDRADGEVGNNYTIACGGVTLTDEAVVPIDAIAVESGLSPLFGAGVTAQKTQMLYTGDVLDNSNYMVRGTWARDAITPSDLDQAVSSAPSFTILARMTKDPLLYDLGTAEEPHCFDQGYGLRVTMPLDGTAPILKIIKFQPKKRIPNLARASSLEVDGAIILAQKMLDTDDLNLDPDVELDLDTYEAGVTELAYEGQWQDMRLRIRRADDMVILEAYLNDRNMNQVVIEYEDRADPLWGAVGVPGIEFLSATLQDQPVGSSPLELSGLSLLRCGIFEIGTFLDVRRPVTITPGSLFTYGRVVDRVIEIVERNGDARYNATTAGQTKIQTYLRFVMDAEADIIRRQGYWEWLRAEQRIYLINGKAVYEMPADFGEMLQIRPGNWNFPPLTALDSQIFRQRLGSTTETTGRPTVYTMAETGVNSLPQVRIFPSPGEDDIPVQTGSQGEDPYLVVEYFRRQIFPSEPDVQIPLVPQQHTDVLVWGAAAHALLMDTDDANSQRVAQTFAGKLKALVRSDFRKGTQRSTMRSTADVIAPSGHLRSPITRATQLENLLVT